MHEIPHRPGMNTTHMCPCGEHRNPGEIIARYPGTILVRVETPHYVWLEYRGQKLHSRGCSEPLQCATRLIKGQSMTIKQMTDAPIVDQLQEHWNKVAAILVWKLAPEGVEITDEDIQEFSRQSKAGETILAEIGRPNGFGFRIIDRAEAERLAAHQASQRGSG